MSSLTDRIRPGRNQIGFERIRKINKGPGGTPLPQVTGCVDVQINGYFAGSLYTFGGGWFCSALLQGNLEAAGIRPRFFNRLLEAKRFVRKVTRALGGNLVEDLWS